jgi:two-component system phosphate regulon sensor histidine kinase PhoR
MSRRKIYALTILMSLALLGVLTFQFYWIQGVVQINEQRFSRQVQEALMDVVQRLEKQEMAQGFLHTSPPPNMPAPDEPAYFGFNDSLNFFFSPGDAPIHQPELRAKVLEHLRRQQKSVWEDRKAMQKQLMDRLRQRQQQADAFVYQFFRQELNPRQRIDSVQLDSLLRKAFDERGITADYQYAVFNLNARSIIYHKSSRPAQLLNSPYRASLFPNDFFGSQTLLSVGFPNQKGYLLSRMALPLALMALFMFTIIGCFAYAVHIILKQKKLSEMKSDFINNMTHEFKTPIATVRMACEALSDPELLKQPNILGRYLGIIGQENQRLGQQVEKVLQIARMERQAPELKYVRLNLAELVEEVAESYRMRLGEGGRLDVQIETPDAWLEADRLHLTNIINNLLDNALKYSPPPAQIRLRLSDALIRQKPALLLSVQDRGQGIAREDLDKIFDKFYRVPTGNVHNVKGFGLGLAYVKYSVEAHGGSISVESTLNQGSTFRVLLPKQPLHA